MVLEGYFGFIPKR